eukprot:GSChrysophyteH1.ASY1.ANO1.647.1 assembled CDS
MGICGSKSLSNLSEDEKRRITATKALDRKMRVEAKEDEDKVKLLLLGSGESGKSTIFKQMKIIYGRDFTEEEKKAQIPIVFLNIIQSIRHLADKLVEFNLQDKLVAKEEFNLIPIQEVWGCRSQYQIIESVKHYFDRLDIIKMPDYVPSKDDLLHTRVKTSGIVTERYGIDSKHYEMYDVGGQKNERKKWIHCFENVTAVIFVAAISEYDQKLYEDGSTNRMVDALELFKDICGNQFFKNSAIILFLNKKDLFETKIKRVNIRDSEPFKDFTGKDGDYQAGVNYFVKKFKDLNSTFKDRPVYHHVTCATDTANVRLCFDLCREIILNNALGDAGF